MSVKPLQNMGRWRGLEGAIEVSAPVTILGATLYFSYTFLGAPAVGRPMTWMELWAILGAVSAVCSWAVSRQMFMLGRTSPWTIVFAGLMVAGLVTFVLPGRVVSSFETTCVETMKGVLIESTPVDASQIDATQIPKGGKLCRVGGVQDNPYLPGTIMRATWNGKVSPFLLVFLGLVSAASSMGLRDVKIRRTAVASKLFSLLRFAPASGSASAMGKPKPNMKKGSVVACGNATLWGETCAQIYASERVWGPGEWCLRCQQPFTKYQKEITFKVTSLFTADVDVLNGIERLDTVSWPRGEPIAPDARLSGEERWVLLGAITLPDVISVAQALALVHEVIPKWAGSENPRVKYAATLAQKRASKVAAWVWYGAVSHRLTYARPTTDVAFALGSQRLRDVVRDGGDEIWLQLDIGLFPLEVRTGFKKTFLEEGRAPELQNSKFDLWIPVSNPRAGKVAANLWVPRVEGDALRLWLSLDRLRPEGVKGATIPLPYLRYNPDDRGNPGSDRAPRPGTLDMVRYPLNANGMEPIAERAVGASVIEWDWLEWEQISQLRQDCLVLEESAEV